MGCPNGICAEEAPDSVGWHFPLPGAKVISPYGKRGKRSHSGVDLKTKPTFSFLLYHKTDTYVFEKLIYIIREAEI